MCVCVCVCVCVFSGSRILVMSPFSLLILGDTYLLFFLVSISRGLLVFSNNFILFLFIFLFCKFFPAFLFIYFWPCHEVCGILVPQPGIEPVPPVVEAQSVTTGPPRNSLFCLFNSELFSSDS